MKQLIRTAALAMFVLTACRASNPSDHQAAPAPTEATVAPVLTTPDALDPHSFAKPLEARVTHVALDLAVDFAAKRIGGSATLDVDRRPDAKQIILDDNGLEIETIADGTGRPLAFAIGAKDPNLGTPLAIQLRPDTRRLVIRYKSAPNAGALLWLAPQQTAGKRYPFLFNQGESIENRSWIPTQDSPGIRQTWEAKITVDKPLSVVMSAPRVGQPIAAGNKRTFTFRTDHSVAPYLI